MELQRCGVWRAVPGAHQSGLVAHDGVRRGEVRMTTSTARGTTAALALLACAAPLVIGVGPVASAAPGPALTLEAAQRTVVLTRYEADDGDGGTVVFVEGDLGMHVVARGRAFEVRAVRASYDEPVVLTLAGPGADRVLTTAPDATGLPAFWTTTITNAAGKVVDRGTASFCPNGYEPVRRRPDAPATSPYPQGCQANPYTLGNVFGIQAGYAVPALTDPEAFSGLPPGSYTVTLAVRGDYASALGMTPAQSRASVAVRLVPGTFEEEPDHAGGDAARPALRTGHTGPLGRRVRPTGPLPDLRSLPAWAIEVEDGRHLTFAATVWNAGPGRLVVDGFRSADPNRMRAYQYFFSSTGQQQGYAPVGTMEWDARDGHDHWHFTDFATYRLLDARKQLVLRSGKEAFCLANTDVVDYLVPGANWRPSNTDLHTSCGGRGSLGVREVLDTGSGDTYAQYLPGQSFDLRGLPNGTYFIEVRANPERALYETRTGNNASYRKVVVGGPAGQRTVTAEKVGRVDESGFLDDGEGAFLAR